MSATIPFYGDVDFNKNQLLRARYENSSTAPTSPATGQVYYDTALVGFYGWNGTSWINLSQVVTNAVTLKGEISNANTAPAYPSTPTIGDQWIVTTNAGTVGGTSVEVGDELIYSTSGWFVIQRNLVAATTAIAGFVRLATQSEANAGSDASIAISPATLAGFLANFLYARKVVTLITSLVANTPTTVTHGLNTVSTNDIQVQCYQGGVQIMLEIKPTSVNALTVQSNQTLANVTVVCQG